MQIEIKNLSIVVVVLLLFSAAVLSGCTDKELPAGKVHGDTSKFIGTWELEPFPGSDPNDTTTYVFYENNTFISTFIDYDGDPHIGFLDYDGDPHIGWGDYTVDNGKMCMKTHPHGAITDDDAYCYDYEFSLGDTYVTLSANELPTVSLMKVE